MEYFIIFVIAFFIGWESRELQAKARIRRYMAEHMQDIVDDVKKDIINITVDFDTSGEIFIYKKEDGSYLAHAKNRDELEDILNGKFPGKMFNASPEDLEKLEAR